MTLPIRSPDDRRTPEAVAAFEAMFRAHYASVCAYVRRFVRSAAVAEELAQDVFTRIWLRLDAVDLARCGRGYLFTAAKRHALNYLNREGLAARYVAGADASELATATSVQDEIEERDLAQRVQAATERLPPRARAVWRLRREAGMSYAEIARELGLSVKTVERHMGRAFKQLRSTLAGYLALLVIASLSA